MKVRQVVDRKKAKEIEKMSRKRIRKVQHIIDACPPVEKLELSPDPNKLPIGQLISACRQFIMGYYENTILNSAFAVEYALLFKINSEIGDDEREALAKKYRGGFDLRYALNRARDNWIDEKLYNELQLLNNLRDMSAHPSNWLTLYNHLGKLLSDEEKTKKWVAKTVNKSPEQIARSLKDELDAKMAKKTLEEMTLYTGTRWANLPDLEWASKKDTLEFQKDYVKRYSSPMINEMITDKKIITLTKNPSSAAEYIIKRYRFPEDTALKALEMAFKTLKQLKII
jgi:hypothetical protein